MAQLTGETGRSNLAEFSGQISEDFLVELRGQQAIKRYDEMRRNSPIIAALLLSIEQSVRSVDWSYVSNDGEEDPRLELLELSSESMSHSWNDHITEALTFLAFGFSLFEIVYQRVGGKILWRKFAPRAQDSVYRWIMDDTGGMESVQQQTVKGEMPVIPIEKLILYRTRVEKGNPEGRSVLRPAWIPYYFVKHMQQIEAIGIERDLAGMPMVKLPENANTDPDDSNSDYSKAARIVRNIRNDEQAGVIAPFGWEFELVSAGGSRAIDIDSTIKRHESRMLMAALAQFLMLGQERVGSLALSRDQSDFFTMSVNATADIIAETHTKYAIPRLMRLNGMNADGLQLEHSLAGDVDLGTLAEFLRNTGTFITWTSQDEVWLRQTARLPDRTPEEIEGERERKEASSQQILNLIRGRQPVPENGREMEMTMFAADNAPDDEERRKHERRWERELNRFFRDQQKRILKAVR